MKLGVNVDHIATLREARHTVYPAPVVGALLAEYAGADSIVVHLREDRRHIKEEDVILIKKIVKIPLNLEMSINKDIVNIALKVKPNQATLVPERRRELTTEGGIDLIKHYRRIRDVMDRLKSNKIRVSLFIDPIKEQIDKAIQLGADLIELNTGRYSESKNKKENRKWLNRIRLSAQYAKRKGLFVAAGHGLDYDNVKEIANIKEIEELNIGHSIICRAVFVGMVSAVEEMIEIINSQT
ncbi:MAG: pyridoxine 5'-phosphate synthase [Candidatus Omnitrophica bacterium]|nr:pyridoxine 5'-phosphate synthase [Candidatus Omnitrophota bacterium]MCM8827282.1 pyridoxine 5'-phosphate synthase [Candidatus Omnitrophota bacterium]